MVYSQKPNLNHIKHFRCLCVKTWQIILILQTFSLTYTLGSD